MIITIERAYISFVIVKLCCIKRQQANEGLDKKITHIFKSHHNRYGSPRITEELRANAENCSKNRVARMKARCIWQLLLISIRGQ
jgi:hypothetical protein